MGFVEAQARGYWLASDFDKGYTGVPDVRPGADGPREIRHLHDKELIAAELTLASVGPGDVTEDQFELLRFYINHWDCNLDCYDSKKANQVGTSDASAVKKLLNGYVEGGRGPIILSSNEALHIEKGTKFLKIISEVEELASIAKPMCTAFQSLTESAVTEETAKWKDGKVIDRRVIRLPCDKVLLAKLNAQKLTMTAEQREVLVKSNHRKHLVTEPSSSPASAPVTTSYSAGPSSLVTVPGPYSEPDTVLDLMTMIRHTHLGTAPVPAAQTSPLGSGGGSGAGNGAGYDHVDREYYSPATVIVREVEAVEETSRTRATSSWDTFRSEHAGMYSRAELSAAYAAHKSGK